LEEFFVHDIYHGRDQGVYVFCAGCEGFDVACCGVVRRWSGR
jgi:hypothetical protein